MNREMRRAASKKALKDINLYDLEARVVQLQNDLQLHREMFAKLVLTLGQKGILKVETKTQGGIIMPDGTKPEDALLREFEKSPAERRG